MSLRRWNTCYSLIILSVVMNSGCALQYYDKTTQTEHLWGIGHMKMKAAPANEDVKAIVKSTEVIGASVSFGDDESHILLGWNNFTRLYVTSESASVRLLWPSSDLFTVRVGSRPPFLSDNSGEDINLKKGESK